MKTAIAAMIAFHALSGTSQALHQAPALEQLSVSAAVEDMPQAPEPQGKDKSLLSSISNHWDPSAPFSYNQRPSSMRPSADGRFTVLEVRSGPTPADHKSYTWETVTIDPAAVTKAYYGYRFYGTGHSFLVFTFSEGGAVDSSGRRLNELTFGAEGWSREPYGYTFSHALKGRYPLVWIATTLESYADYLAGVKKRDTFFQALDIGREDAARLLRLLADRIEETNRDKEYYDLFRNSCTNNPVDLINQVVPGDKRIALEVAGLANPNAAVPKFAVKRYTSNGVLSPEVLRLTPGNYTTFSLPR